METRNSLDKYQAVLNKTYFKKLGKVENVVGLTIESAGPDAKMGDLCRIYTDAEKKNFILAEVVGFKDKKTLLMPYEVTDGIGLGCIVENMNYPLCVPVGESLLGKTLDGLGSNCWLVVLFCLFFFFYLLTWLVRSQFLDQGLNQGHSHSPNHWTTKELPKNEPLMDNFGAMRVFWN